jgi:hypothetical protein
MNKKISGVLKAAASLSLAGGILAAAALPAAAASPNEAYGAAATGVINVSPVAEAAFPGTSPVTLAHINIPGLLHTGLVTDTADATSASSTIADVRATLSALATLRADAVTSSCRFDPNTGTVSGTSGITNGRVTITGLPTITLAAAAPPNTTVSVPGIATITLNRQTTATDGTLTVDAIYVSLLGSRQTLTIATSVCNKASLAPVPILPGKSLAFGLGGLSLLSVGGVCYQFSRRRRQAAAA